LQNLIFGTHSSSLKLIQDCFADASKASIGRHVVEGDFTRRRYSSNTNDCCAPSVATSEYGLAATIWTRNLKTALDGAHRLEAGFVQVNQNLVVTSSLSYGGVKNSGLGKEASLEAMLEHFTHKKTIILNMQ
jgi:delta 1-pyrroline-5-carboxylate dehydrogenase